MCCERLSSSHPTRARGGLRRRATGERPGYGGAGWGGRRHGGLVRAIKKRQPAAERKGGRRSIASPLGAPGTPPWGKATERGAGRGRRGDPAKQWAAPANRAARVANRGQQGLSAPPNSRLEHSPPLHVGRCRRRRGNKSMREVHK